MPSLYPSYPPYIPVIKWQKAEQQALEAVEEGVVNHVWPCIEVRGVTNSQQLMGELYHFWKGTALIDYADPSGRLAGRRMKEFESFLALASNKNYPIIPVLDSRDVQDLSPRALGELISQWSRVSRVGLTDLQINSDFEIHRAPVPRKQTHNTKNSLCYPEKKHLKQRILCISWPAVHIRTGQTVCADFRILKRFTARG